MRRGNNSDGEQRPDHRRDNEKRMSREEIDEILCDIRKSRSQSRPKRPEGPPPELPDEYRLPFGGCARFIPATGPPEPPPRRKRGRDQRRRRMSSGSGNDSSRESLSLGAEKIMRAADDKVEPAWNKNPVYQEPRASSSSSTNDAIVVEDPLVTVQNLKDRLQTMSQELDKVKLAADRLDGGCGNSCHSADDDSHRRMSWQHLQNEPKLFSSCLSNVDNARNNNNLR